MRTLIDALSRLAYGTKTPATRRAFIGATQTQGDVRSGRSQRTDTEASRLIDSLTSYAFIAAQYVGRTAAGVEMRVYAPERTAGLREKRKGRRATARGRVLSAQERKRRADPVVYGSKVAMLMDSRGEVEELNDHPARYLLDRPSYGVTGTQFRTLRHMLMPVVGNAYTLISFQEDNPDGIGARYDSSEGQPVCLYSLYPQHVIAIPDPDEIRMPGGYRYARDKSNPIEIDADRVIHARHLPSPVDPFKGEGVLWSVLRGLNVLTQRQIAQESIAGANFRPDYVLSLPGADEAMVANFEAAMASRFANSHTAGQFLTAYGTEVMVSPLGWPVRPEEQTGLDVHIRQEILAGLGVPESLIAMNDASLGADGLPSGMIQFHRLTIRPALRNESDDLNEGLAPYWPDDEILFSADDPVPEDVDRKADLWGKHMTAGAVTANEYREAFGLEAIDDEAANQLGGPAAAPAPPAPGVVGFSVSGHEGKGSGRSVALDRAAAGVEAVPERGLEDGFGDDGLIVVRPKRVCTCGHDHDADRAGSGEAGGADEPAVKSWSLPDYFQTFGSKAAISNVLTEAEMAQVARNSPRFRSILDKLLPQLAAGDLTREQFAEIFAKETAPIYWDSFRLGGEIGVSQLGESGFEVQDAWAEDYIQQNGTLLGETVYDSAGQFIADKIEEMAQTGVPIAERTAILREELAELTPARADMIARTETQNAVQNGRLKMWSEIGVTEIKWQQAGAACPICKVLDKRVVPIGTPFAKVGERIGPLTVSYRDIIAPPAHPNCRCDALPAD